MLFVLLCIIPVTGIFDVHSVTSNVKVIIQCLSMSYLMRDWFTTNTDCKTYILPVHILLHTNFNTFTVETELADVATQSIYVFCVA